LGADVIGMTNLQEAKLARDGDLLRHRCHGDRLRLLARGNDSVPSSQIVACCTRTREAARVVKAACGDAARAELRLRTAAKYAVLTHRTRFRRRRRKTKAALWEVSG